MVVPSFLRIPQGPIDSTTIYYTAQMQTSSQPEKGVMKALLTVSQPLTTT